MTEVLKEIVSYDITKIILTYPENKLKPHFALVLIKTTQILCNTENCYLSYNFNYCKFPIRLQIYQQWNCRYSHLSIKEHYKFSFMKQKNIGGNVLINKTYFLFRFIS